MLLTELHGKLCWPIGTLMPSSFCSLYAAVKFQASLEASPHQVFEAEPDSALAHMYNGNWEYYKDNQGRANANSNPVHWPLILNWLSFGTIPTHPTEEFLSECSFWHFKH